MNKHEKLKKLLTEPIRNICHSFYDDYVEVNAKIRSSAGVKTIIVRRTLGKCCDWCSKLAGIYDYTDAPYDIYKRHDGCKCIVTVRNEAGTYTDVWSKKEYQNQRAARLAREKEIETSEIENVLKVRTRDIVSRYVGEWKKGDITYEPGFRKNKNANEVHYAEVVHSLFGGDIQLLKANDNYKRADYLWNNKYWELKSFSSANSLDTHIKKKALYQIEKKPGGFILVSKNPDFRIADIEKAILYRLNRSAMNHGIKEIDYFVFSGDEIILAGEWKHKK